MYARRDGRDATRLAGGLSAAVRPFSPVELRGRIVNDKQLRGRARPVCRADVDRVIRLGLAAGERIVALTAECLEIRRKSDGSPVTSADHVAEDLIVAGLQGLWPQIPVVAEERVSDGQIPTCENGCFFLVDALDGTNECVGGGDEFTVNIALIQDGLPVFGVVLAPRKGVGFCGTRAGAWKFSRDEGGLASPRSIHARGRTRTVAALVSKSHQTEQTRRYLENYPDASVVHCASSLKLCRLAEGMADLYPRLGRTMQWDIAAGDAVLRGAGGSVQTLNGLPMMYGKPDAFISGSFGNDHFVAFGDWSPEDIRDALDCARKSL